MGTPASVCISSGLHEFVGLYNCHYRVIFIILQFVDIVNNCTINSHTSCILRTIVMSTRQNQAPTGPSMCRAALVDLKQSALSAFASLLCGMPQDRSQAFPVVCLCVSGHIGTACESCIYPSCRPL